MGAQAYMLIWHIMYFAVMVPIIIGNGLIVLSVMKFRKLRSNMHILIANLAISDFIVGVVLIPYSYVTDDDGSSHENMYICFVKLSLFVVCLGSSCFNLMLISLERFVSITNPLTSKLRFTTCRMTAMIAFGWVVAIVNGGIPFVGWNKYGGNNTACVSDTLWASGYKNMINWEMVAAFIGNVVMYTVVIRKALKKAHAKTNLKGGFTVHAKIDKDLNHLLTMAIVLGLFIVCWLPYICMAVVVTFHETPTTQFIRRCTLVPGLFNSAINWLIYGYRNQDFRNAFKSFLTCQCLRSPKEHSQLFTVSFRQSRERRNGTTYAWQMIFLCCCCQKVYTHNASCIYKMGLCLTATMLP